jgi:NAD(P)-dependent dehydrogenase (short-subunit alcohol dehydrogenase family)
VPTALIIGASGGIGHACARALGEAGFELVLNARREAPLRDLIRDFGARQVLGDCNDAAVLNELAESATGLDIVVHAAGVLKGSAARTQPVELFDEVIATNLRSVYALVHAVLPHVNAGGRVMFISSLAATRPFRGLTAYSASKAGVNALARSLAAELEREGINVTVVIPGAIDSAMMRDSINPVSALPASDVGEAVAWLAARPPRVVIPELLLRAPFHGPYANPVGGEGQAGEPFDQ